MVRTRVLPSFKARGVSIDLNSPIFRNWKLSQLVLLPGGHRSFTWFLSGPKGISQARRVRNPPLAKKKKSQSFYPWWFFANLTGQLRTHTHKLNPTTYWMIRLGVELYLYEFWLESRWPIRLTLDLAWLIIVYFEPIGWSQGHLSLYIKMTNINCI